jgi:hypothetical protein
MNGKTVHRVNLHRETWTKMWTVIPYWDFLLNPAQAKNVLKTISARIFQNMVIRFQQKGENGD